VVEKLKEEKIIKKPIKLFFQDEMRFGLISNYRRSWSQVGERTVIANQQEFSNRYLYSAIDPITGDNFQYIGFSDVNASVTKKFLEALQEEYKDFHIIMVWDNAPFHRKQELHEMNGITPIFLPPYSPELNPVERFYGEIRKVTANRIFKDIYIQQSTIEQEVARWMNDKIKTIKLCSYRWIVEQWNSLIEVGIKTMESCGNQQDLEQRSLSIF
jgi:transposase